MAKSKQSEKVGTGMIQLKSIPKNVKKLILKKQGQLREECGCLKSQETTVYTIINEWAEAKSQVAS